MDLLWGRESIRIISGMERPVLASNFGHPSLNTIPWSISSKGGVTLLFLNLLGGDLYRAYGLESAGIWIEPMESALDHLSDSIDSGEVPYPACIVAIWHTESADKITFGNRFASIPLISILGSHVVPRDEAFVNDRTLLINSHPFGVSISNLDLWFGKGERKEWFDLNRFAVIEKMAPGSLDAADSHRLQLYDTLLHESHEQAGRSHLFELATIPVGMDLREDTSLSAAVDELGKLVPESNAFPLEASWYMGADLCRECHPAEHQTWMVTPHAHAYSTLHKNGAQDRLQCLSCHNTGFGYPHGPKRIAELTGLTDVQCESCHLPTGRPHPSTEVAFRPVDVTSCLMCHTKSQSPEFDYPLYLRTASCQSRK